MASFFGQDRTICITGDKRQHTLLQYQDGTSPVRVRASTLFVVWGRPQMASGIIKIWQTPMEDLGSSHSTAASLRSKKVPLSDPDRRILTLQLAQNVYTAVRAMPL
jgi:hypothetical protein